MSRPLEIHVNLSITFSSSREMNSVMNALIPDNVNFPAGLSMRIIHGSRAGKRVAGKSAGTSRTIVLRLTSTELVSTLVNTLDELLEHASVASKVIS